MTNIAFSRYFGNMRGFNLRRGLMICGLLNGNPFKPSILSRLHFSINIPLLDFGNVMQFELNGEFTTGVKYLYASVAIIDPNRWDEWNGDDWYVKFYHWSLLDNRNRIKRRRERLQTR